MSEEQPPYGNQEIEKHKKQQAVLRKYAAIQRASEEKIGCQKVYVDMTNDLEAAFVLDELVFYTLPRPGSATGLRVRKDGVLWMAVRRNEWWDRKRITARQADRAIEKLEKANLIITSVHKFNGQNTVHIRLNVDEFFKAYFSVIEKNNPPEDENDTTNHDINELYEMMGISRLPNGELPNGDEVLPNGETSLPNGNLLTPLTQPVHNPRVLSEIEAKANATVDALLDQERRVQGKANYPKRESLPEPIRELMDVFVETTGIKPRGKEVMGWMAEVSDWLGFGTTARVVREAVNYAKGKFDVVTPFSLTNTLRALVAKSRRTDEERPEYKPFVPPDESEFVPNPYKESPIK